MWDFFSGTVSHAKLSLHWSVILCHVTFEWHSGRAWERSIIGVIPGPSCSKHR